MENKNTIFWCGSILTFEGLNKFKGEAPSATIWTREILTGFSKNSINVKIFAPIWDAMFPKGYLFPGSTQYLDPNFNQQNIKYLNIPYIRKYSLARNLFNSIQKEIEENGEPKAIINYNTYPHYIIALKKIKEKYPNIKWINYILDLDDPDKDNWLSYSNDVKGSDGCIFLSWWGFKNTPTKNKLYVEAGWNGKLPESSITDKFIFIYAGKLSAYGGINDLIEIIKIYKNKDVQFHFYGKGKNLALEDLAQNDKRVHIKGFVSDEELKKACESANGFLSPRDVNCQENKMIFPSKILYYLKFRKPIISQDLPGLPPEYHNVLFIPKSSSYDDWINEIKRVKELSKDETKINFEKSTALLEIKKWSNQTLKIMSFINELNNENS
ncbi:glycosyltransferase [Flammeovirga sp. SJP92]|uniref:glycosyltransferase n=1 Tax=Flammeovirga sp. SJP92 TaxID=1775430 RepID=UPI000786D9C5|nr:glycosyltransferase [Flammeovirga sp. SJP92]KXX72551.1 hypothetical protein AVL50_00330 [Flammeovirga sp. SJP92]